MSLQLMKERIKQSGKSLYEEQIKDAQKALEEGFYNDVSYNPNIVIYKTEKHIPIKMYSQKYSASYGFTSNFIAPINHFIELGEVLFDTARNDYWLCVETYDVDGIHNKGKLGKCMRFLKWQDKDGKILEEPIIVTSAAKYNNGERGDEVMMLPSDQLLLMMQRNEDTIQIDRGIKFFIDENKEKPSVYEVTRVDTALYTYMGKGFLSIIATERAYTPTEKELALGICNYVEVNEENVDNPALPPQDKTGISSAVILGNKDLKTGYGRTYAACFFDRDGKEMDWHEIAFHWDIASTFDVGFQESQNKVRLTVDDESYIGKSFVLQVKLEDGSVIAENSINVTAGF